VRGRGGGEKNKRRNKLGGKNTKRGVDDHAVEEVLGAGGKAEGGHGLEHPERVALVNELVGVTLVEGSSDQENDIVDHVAVGDVVKEGGEGLGGMGPEVLELGNHLLRAFLWWGAQLFKKKEKGMFEQTRSNSKYKEREGRRPQQWWWWPEETARSGGSFHNQSRRGGA